MMPNQRTHVVSKKICWSGVFPQTLSLKLGGELLVALRGCDELTLNLEGVELLDLSCLVLMCAVKRQANEKGKTLLLEGLENPVIEEVVQSYRSNGNRLCRTYCGNSCLFDSEN